MFDIYGNPLKSGHCEVHPHIAQVYPCSQCMQEKRNQEIQQQNNQQNELNLTKEKELIDCIETMFYLYAEKDGKGNILPMCDQPTPLVEIMEKINKS